MGVNVCSIPEAICTISQGHSYQVIRTPCRRCANSHALFSDPNALPSLPELFTHQINTVQWNQCQTIVEKNPSPISSKYYQIKLCFLYNLFILFFILIFLIKKNYSVTIVYIFSPSLHPTPTNPTSLPHHNLPP